jgi:hypothetical protein
VPDKPKTSFSDPLLAFEAMETAKTSPRSLRRVKDVPTRDSVMFEDRETGERRVVPNKVLLILGETAGFELADLDPAFADLQPKSNT